MHLVFFDRVSTFWKVRDSHGKSGPKIMVNEKSWKEQKKSWKSPMLDLRGIFNAVVGFNPVCQSIIHD